MSAPKGPQASAARVRPAFQRIHVGVVDLVAVVVFQSAVLLPIGLTHPVDGDEGFYSVAAKLVAHHHELYVDFWYQQAPLLPYVYGGWQKLFGQSWHSLRLLSCFVTVALGALLYLHVARRFSSRRLGAIAVIVYASAPLVFHWFLLIKTYALSSLLLFAGYMLVGNSDRFDDHDGGPERWRWTCAGLLAGLAADVRFVLAPTMLVFVYYAMRSRTKQDRGPNVGVTVAGLVVGLMPSIYFFSRGHARFINDTLVSQTTRSNLKLGPSINQKLRVLGELLSEPHVLIPTIAVVTVIAVLVRHRQRVPMAIAIAAVLSVANLIPSPSYEQYFSILVPFLVVGAIELVPIIRAAMPASNSSQLASILCAVGVATVALSLVTTAYGIDATNQSHAFPVRPSNIGTVSKAIDALTRPGEVVLSTWPGWLYEVHAQPLPGTESDFIPGAAEISHLSAAQARRYHMISYADIARTIGRRNVRVVIVGYGFARALPLPRLLARARYRLRKVVDGVDIYVRGVT